MQNAEGKIRVIIQNLSTEINGGRYAAKRVTGERFEVKADIYADGHDRVRAFLRYKAPAGRTWQEEEFEDLGNHRWAAAFTPEKQGFYTYTIHAWIDHFATWYDKFLKKQRAGQFLEVELLEGAAFLRKLADSAAKTKATALNKAATLLEDRKKYEDAVNYVISADFAALVKENPLKANETRYPGELSLWVDRPKALFSAWYEFFPRSAAQEPGKHGTFKDCERLLPRVAAMGFDVLYFPPIHPIGEKHRKGKNNAVTSQPGEPGSPWAIGSKDGGHDAIHKELGTLADYKRLIKKANDLGIEIALDLALQCAPDHPWVKEHPEWFIWRPDGTVQYAENPPKKYQDILPINFECAEWESLWQEIKKVVIHWVDSGVRIFRVDNPHTKPIPFWEWLIAEVHQDHPDIIFLSEAFTKPRVMEGLGKAGFTQGYTYFTWRNNKHEMMEYMDELVNTQSREYFRPNFWPNTPDILPYFLQNSGPNGFVNRLALAATLSSSYGIYGPVYEHYVAAPVEGKEEYWDSEKYEIQQHDWESTNRLTDIITLINKARKENPALQSTWNVHFVEVHNDNLIAYFKATGDKSNMILTVVNMDPHNTHSGHLQLPLKEMGISGGVKVTLQDLITQDSYEWTEEWNYVELNPHVIPFHLFKVTVH